MVETYLDASVVVPLFIEEFTTPAISTWVKTTPRRMLLSDFAAAEVASAFSLAVRTGRIPQDESAWLLGEFDAWRSDLTFPTELHAQDIRAAHGFVRRFDLKLRTPDAIHAATANRIGATLITLDRRLLTAAAALGIAAASPVAAHT